LSAVGAVGFAVDFEDDGAVDNAIEEGSAERWLAEVFGPRLEVHVGDQGGRASPVAGVNDLEEDVGRLGRLFAFDEVVAEFVKLC
jgi:hypothetical protein